MSCNSPNKVFYIGENPETGKKKIFFTSRYTDFIYKPIGSEKWNTYRLPEAHHGSDYLSTRNPSLYEEALKAVRPLPGETIITDFDIIPCGQCIGCRMDNARNWAARMMLESKKYKKNEVWFVTLTYDDDHLPPAREILDETTGEYKLSPFHSVSKDDHVQFMKRLRKEYGNGIRFFMSAEYG